MREYLHNLLTVFLGGMFLLALFLGYWQVVRAPALALHPANPRVGAIERTLQRGTIFDREGRVIVRSQQVGKDWQREFLAPETLAPVVGYTSRARGRTGLEAAYDRYLLGQDERQALLNLVGSWFGRPPRGNDLYLTLDLSLQQAATQALGGRRGAVIALDPRSGAVLVAASSPGFSPNRLEEEWSRLAQDPTSPLLNRLTQGLYPPGSVFKLIVASGVLAEGLTNLSEEFFCPGYIDVQGHRIHCFRGIAHGRLDLARALSVSCNVTFIQLGLRLGEKRFLRYARAFGLTGRIPTDLALKPSRLPPPRRIDRHALAQLSIGQGEILVTPLQMALVAAAIANDGEFRAPYFVQEVRAPDGAVTLRGASRVHWQAIPTATARILRTLMGRVVREGTGVAAQIAGVSVGGKTGTAENPHGLPHAWFVGLSPIEAPRIAIAVVLENAGQGGVEAAPVARAVLLAARRGLL